MKNAFLSLVVIVLLSSALPLHANPPESPLLPAGTLSGSAGDQLSVVTIGKEKGVVLLLLKSPSSGGEKLLAFLESLETPLPADRLLVVAGGVDEKLLNATATRHVNLAARWYRDTDNLLANGLGLKADPVIVGVRDGRAIWITAGMADQKLLEKTMRGWLNNR